MKWLARIAHDFVGLGCQCGSRLARWLAAFAVLAAFVATPVAAAVDGFPSVAQVQSAAAGRDELETSARQRAALAQMAELVELLAQGQAPRRALSADERQLRADYSKAVREIERQTLAGFDPAETKRLGPNSPRVRWYNLTSRFERDVGFRTEVIEPLLAPALRERLRQVTAGQQQAQLQKRQALEASTRAQQAAREVAQQAETNRRDQIVLRVAWMTALPLLAVAGLALLSQPPGIRGRSDQPKAYLGGRRALEFRVLRGRVTGLAERSDTYVSGGSGPGGPNFPVSVSISSTVRVTQKFFLQREDSPELLPVTLSDVDIPLANGHRLGLIWAELPKGRDESLAMLVNHEAQRWWQLGRGAGLVRRFGLVRNWLVPGLVVQGLSFFAPWEWSALAALPALAIGWIFGKLAVVRAAKPLDEHLADLAQQELAGVTPAPPAAVPEAASAAAVPA